MDNYKSIAEQLSSKTVKTFRNPCRFDEMHSYCKPSGNYTPSADKLTSHLEMERKYKKIGRHKNSVTQLVFSDFKNEILLIKDFTQNACIHFNRTRPTFRKGMICGRLTKTTFFAITPHPLMNGLPFEDPQPPMLAGQVWKLRNSA